MISVKILLFHLFKLAHLLFILFILFINCFYSQQQQQLQQLQQSQQPSNIQVETYKALFGETIQLECPQSAPTWFFRHIDSELEDLIVTRHGIVNVEYKYKITCHPTLKHKIISINKVNSDDEGVYTCLYTTNNPNLMNDDSFIDTEINMASFQQRLSFNVTVYTMISGLTMSIKPVTTQQTQKLPDPVSVKTNNQKSDYSDNVLTVRENEEFFVNCIVERSKPPATIQFSIGEQEPADSFTSLVSTNKNVIKNSDKTYKTLHVSRLKAHVNDHGKAIYCKAENGMSNQKWENRRLLNILFAPVCKDPPGFQYFTGINQTANIECRVKNANPNQVKYEWHFNSLMSQRQSIRETLNIVNEGFMSRVQIKPTGLHDFGEVKCKVTNDVGSTYCNYELKLGGIPNPPYDCTYTLKNSSAIVFCQVGYHQGDPDLYCYLLRKSDNGVYKEHTRSRDSCSFIISDVNENKINEFWVYTSNKYGHNKDTGVHLIIGQLKKASIETSNNKTWIIIGSVCGGLVLLMLIYCFYAKIRKGLSDDNDSVYDPDSYQARNNNNVVENRSIYNDKMNKQLKSNGYDDENDNLKDDNKLMFISFKDNPEDTYLRNSTIKETTKNNNEEKYFTYSNKQSLLDDDDDVDSQTKSVRKFPFINNNNNNKQDKRTSSGNNKSSFHQNTYEKSILTNLNNDSKLRLIKTETDESDSPIGFMTKDQSNGYYGLEPAVYHLSDDSSNMMKSGDDNNSCDSIIGGSGDGVIHSPQHQTSSVHKMVTFSSTVKETLNKSAFKRSSLTKSNSSSNDNNATTDRSKPAEFKFSSNNSNNLYSTVSKADHVHHSPLKLPPPPPTPPNKSNTVDSYESNFLNNLCEEIEFSLNVDCDCGDETSSSAQCVSNTASDLSTDSSMGYGYTRYKPPPPTTTATKDNITNHENNNNNKGTSIIESLRKSNKPANGKNIRNGNTTSPLHKPLSKTIGVLV